MSELEQQILDLIQDAFPLVERPYLRLAEMLNELAANCDGVNEGSETGAKPVVSEQDVFEAVERLRASGVIRRIGGVYDSKKLGFISRLCAGKVPAASLDFSAEQHELTAMEKFAAAVKEVSAITHNYIRSHEYNVWFTVIDQNENEIQSIVDKLCDATDLHDVHVMSATRKFKINTVMALDERRKTTNASGEYRDQACLGMIEPSIWDLSKDERGERCGAAAAPVVSKQWLVNRDSDEREKTDVIPAKAGISSKDFTASDKLRIRTSCEDIPHSLTPFKDWGVSCDELREDIASKRMRRFGAILRHQNAGFAFNAMVCFNIDERRKTKDERGECCGAACRPIAEPNSLASKGKDERGERCGAAIAPVGSKQWLVNRDSDERRVILSGEAAKGPVKSCDLIAQAGSLLASNLHISHCYERPSFDGFPYNVYAMMHANSAEQLNQYIADCVKSLNELQSSPVDYVVLRSVRELKKTSFKFFA